LAYGNLLFRTNQLIPSSIGKTDKIMSAADKRI
jgi:hypothetical protein